MGFGRGSGETGCPRTVPGRGRHLGIRTPPPRTFVVVVRHVRLGRRGRHTEGVGEQLPQLTRLYAGSAAGRIALGPVSRRTPLPPPCLGRGTLGVLSLTRPRPSGTQRLTRHITGPPTLSIGFPTPRPHPGLRPHVRHFRRRGGRGGSRCFGGRVRRVRNIRNRRVRERIRQNGRRLLAGPVRRSRRRSLSQQVRRSRRLRLIRQPRQSRRLRMTRPVQRNRTRRLTRRVEQVRPRSLTGAVSHGRTRLSAGQVRPGRCRCLTRRFRQGGTRCLTGRVDQGRPWPLARAIHVRCHVGDDARHVPLRCVFSGVARGAVRNRARGHGVRGPGRSIAAYVTPSGDGCPSRTRCVRSPA